MLSCKDVCHIVSESLDRQLPWHERFAVRLHLCICNGCRQMVRQMKLLGAAALRYGADAVDTGTAESEVLSDEARSRIAQRLQHARNDPDGTE